MPILIHASLNSQPLLTRFFLFAGTGTPDSATRPTWLTLSLYFLLSSDVLVPRTPTASRRLQAAASHAPLLGALWAVIGCLRETCLIE